MSAFSEQEPTSPQDLLHYAPRRRGERSGPRLRTVTSSVDETTFDPPFRVDAASSPFAPQTSFDDELEDAIGETLRRHLEPQMVPEPVAFVQERSRRGKVLMVGGGIAFAVGVAAVVALLVVTEMAGSRDHGAGSVFAAAAALGLPGGTAKPVVPVSAESDQAATGDQSQQLLERFIQWRQKDDATQHQ
jgi:hypothetical protein